MKKETVSYVKHILGSDYVQIDFLNAVVALAIIAVSFIAFISDNVLFFCIAFILGAVLALFNLIKSIMKKSALGSVVFGAMVPVLLAVAFFIKMKIG